MNDQLVAAQSRIISLATSFIGQEEIQPNKGFKNADFERMIRSVDWLPGESWCAALTKYVWLTSYQDRPVIYSRLRHLVSLNAQENARNFHNDPVWPTSPTTILPGSLCVWQEGSDPVKGHIGICIDPIGTFITISGNTKFTTVEGNSNSDGSRNGYMVCQHTHTLGLPFRPDNLNFVRAIHPLPLDYTFSA